MLNERVEDFEDRPFQVAPPWRLGTQKDSEALERPHRKDEFELASCLIDSNSRMYIHNNDL